MEGIINLVYHFTIPQGTLPWQPIKVAKSAFLANQSSLSRCFSKADCNITISISKVQWHVLCTILVRFGPVTSKFTLLKKTTFAAIRQKSAYQAKYLRISWTDLYQIYRFGRHMSGLIILTFAWHLSKGHCYGNQLNLGEVCWRWQEWPLLFALAFDNRLADCQAAFKGFSGNNPATLCTNLVNFCPKIWEFMLLKCAIFAVIRLQLDDRSLFVTWAFWNKLKCRNLGFRRVIGNHFCTSCRNLVRFGLVTPEFNT